MKFVIQGEKPLKGTVEISGMKNAATPILAATLLTSQSCVIDNIPRIADVEKMLEILQSLGSQFRWLDPHKLWICNKDVSSSSLNKQGIQAMRSSILLLGPCLARFASIEIPEPGGCIIGNRPIDTHLYALEKLGAKIVRNNSYYRLESGELKGANIILPEFSVTATENILMAASLAKGKTVIELAAAEPHVQNLGFFLRKMGAKIRGLGTHRLEIQGVKKLNGTELKIIPDQIEAGTFAVAAAATRGHLKIKNIVPEHLGLVLLKLSRAGVNLKLGSNFFEILPSVGLKAFRLQTLPYPGFPTDLQAPFGVLATQCTGSSLIQDPLYEGRMGYVGELVKMGANAIVADPHRVVITGPTPLYGQEIKSFDLRAGATLIIAGLVAQGQTVINQAEIVDRGYERIEEKLSKLGADIKRV